MAAPGRYVNQALEGHCTLLCGFVARGGVSQDKLRARLLSHQPYQSLSSRTSRMDEEDLYLKDEALSSSIIARRHLPRL